LHENEKENEEEEEEEDESEEKRKKIIKKKNMRRSVLKRGIDHDHDNVDYECLVVIKYFLWTLTHIHI